MRGHYRAVARAAYATMGQTAPDALAAPAADAGSPGGEPDWAKRMRTHQAVQHGATTAAHAVHAGDSHSGGASINLKDDH